MSSWKSGMIAVCVEPDGYGLLLGGSTYTVGAVYACVCGRVALTVGIEDCEFSYHCFRCDAPTPCKDQAWFRADRFRPYEPLKEEMDRIESEAVSAPAEVETVPA